MPRATKPKHSLSTVATSESSSFVPVVGLQTPRMSGPAAVAFPWGRYDDLEWRLQAPMLARLPRPEPLRAALERFTGLVRKQALARSLKSLTTHAGLVLRASLVKKAYSRLGLEPEDFRPVHLTWQDELIDDDFALLDPTQWWPIDREAAVATWSDMDRLHAGTFETLRELRWAPGREPPGLTARILETPVYQVMRRDVAEALLAVLPGQLAIVEPPYPLQYDYDAPPPRPLVPPQFRETPYPWVPPAVETSEAGRATAEAFWRIAAERRSRGPTPGTPHGTADDRALACQNPHYALALALCLDREAYDDTARGVLGSPLRALQFAMWVDSTPLDETRLAASRHHWLAVSYARDVDHGRHPVTEEAVASSEWAQEYATMAATVEPEWLTMLGRGDELPPLPEKPPVAAAPSEPVPPRDWPAHDVPRYAEVSTDGTAERLHETLDAPLRSDIDAFIGHGLALLELDTSARPDVVVSALHRFVARVQSREHKLGNTKKRAVMALGCALGDASHRALGWQWARVKTPEGGGVAMVAPDASGALYPLYFVERHLEPGGRHNQVALQFNMLASGSVPPGSTAVAYVAVT